MAEIVSLRNQDLNRFISGEKGKILTYLRKNYSVSDEDIDDIFQESSMALYLNIRDGKLSNLTSSLGTYFMKVCINQTLKFLGKSSKVVPLVDDSRISNGSAVRDDKIDELYGFCMDTEEEDRKIRMELLVNNIIASMTDTCKNILQGYYWNDLSTSTIADVFGFSDANSVKAQKYKCVKKFREKYNELKNKIYG
jgi:RNA polymerase sigma-70 factor (ECF subfamily)